MKDAGRMLHSLRFNASFLSAAMWMGSASLDNVLENLRVRIEGFTYELVVVCDGVDEVSTARRNHYFRNYFAGRFRAFTSSTDQNNKHVETSKDEIDHRGSNPSGPAII